MNRDGSRVLQVQVEHRPVGVFTTQDDWQNPKHLLTSTGSEGHQVNQFTRLEAIAIWLEAMAIRLEAIAIGLEAIAIRLEAIAIRLEAIVSICLQA